MKVILFNKYLLLLFLLILGTAQLFSQKESYNWYFGDSCGITFMPDGKEATYLLGGVTKQMEGVSTLSDRNGNLLFYAGDNTIWNNKHQLLLHGVGLKGNYSSARSMIIVPKPGSNQYYYVFTIWAMEYIEEHNGQYYDTNGLRYSMIDILADNGNGDIISATKNTKLLDNAVEKMITINHSNKTDIWLIAYNWQDNNYYTYLITKDGITEHKRTQRPFAKFDKPNPNAAGFNLEYDFQHNKLISCDADIHSFVIYDFNTTTGIINTTNPVTIPAYPNDMANIEDTTKYVPYSAAVSADGTKFYGSCYRRAIVQWDLSVTDNDEIIKTRTVVCDTNTASVNNFNFGTIRKGPNNKMYIARDKATWLAMINEPNNSVNNCGFISNGVYLEGKQSRYGLPIMMNYSLPPCEFDGYAGGNKNLCYGNEIILGGNYDTTNFTFQWTPATNLDNPNILHPICNTTQTMQYVLMIRDNILGCIDYDTIIVNILDKPNVVPAEDVVTCKNSSVTIGNINNNPNYVYEWSPTEYLENPNSSVTLCTTNKDMQYILSILDNSTGCYSYDTVFVNVRNLDSFELLGSMYICDGKNTIISVKDDFISYYWSTGESTKSISIDEIGTYEVIVTDSNGCSGKRTFEINYLKTEDFNIIAPNNICEGIETILRTNIPFNKYLWSNGDTTPTTTIYSAGTYWINVENDNGCQATDTIVINAIELSYSFPNEIILPVSCDDTTEITNIFKNNGNENIIISNISLISDTYFKIKETFIFPIDIVSNNSTNITIKFYANDIGKYNDTLIIAISEPCSANIIIPIIATVNKSNVNITTTPIKTTPGKRVTIPINIVIEDISTSEFSYNIKCSYRRDMIQVDSINVGTITNRIQNDLIETIQIETELINTNNILLELFANTSLGMDTISDIIFFDLETPIPCTTIDSTFVPFQLIGCNLNSRIFDFFTPTELSVENENNYNYNCEILSEEKGNFSISIHNLIGEVVRNVSWNKENYIVETKNIIINNFDLPSGYYFIILKSPNYIIRKQVLKIK